MKFSDFSLQYSWRKSKKICYLNYMIKRIVRTKVLTKFRCDLYLWTQNISSSHHPASMYEIWRLYVEKLLKLSCQNQNVDKVPLWPWPFDSKMYRYLPLTILHLFMKYESCTLKTSRYRVNQKDDEVQLWPWPLIFWPHHVCVFLSPSCIYVWNMRAVRWKLLKFSCQNQRVDGQTDGQPDSYRTGP